ncbi:MAG TPA: winged helix-turn-helix domain-containing protein [Woeseiaceae bacterium]|nr:winged helix-turn-helix domain-containing protein [Woeseiaceae bacterium]
MNVAERALYCSGQPVHVQRKPFDVLAYLIEQAPRMVPRAELLERFWSVAVNDESLTRCISTIRKLLGDSEDPPRLIETYRAQGYRFIGRLEGEERPVAPATGDTHEQRAAPARIRSRLWLAAGFALLVAVLAIGTHELRKGRATAVEGRIARIAVIPIQAVGDQDAWLATALTDHLMRAVSRIEGVTVVTYSGAAAGIDPPDIGRRLNVEAVLLSRLERLPESTRLSARLVSTGDSRLIWSSSVDSREPVTDSRQVELLAHQAAVRLRPKLLLQDLPDPVDAEAYRHYLQGRYYWEQRSAIGFRAAINAFEAALAREPNYTDALLGAADSWLLLPLYETVAPTQAVPQARSLAERALELDPDNAGALTILGSIEMLYAWNWSRAESLLREAVTLNPNDATAQQRLGELYCCRSRFGECQRRMRKALDLDPLSAVLTMEQGSPYLWAGDYQAAADHYQAAAEKNPELGIGRYSLGLAYAGLGEWEAAARAYESAMPDLGLAMVGGPLVYARARIGDLNGARTLLAQLESLQYERYVPPSKLAIAHLGLGNRERAKALFLEAIEAHDDRLVYFDVDVHTRDLKLDPAFREISQRLGFDPSHRSFKAPAPTR